MGVTYTVEYICIDGTTLSVTLYKDSRLFNNNGGKEKKEKKKTVMSFKTMWYIAYHIHMSDTVECIRIDVTTLSVTLYNDSRLFNNNEKKKKKEKTKKNKKQQLCYEF